ncbi:MAG: metal-dependent phosphohydrolase [Acidobacteria bacterium SCN 69-37]|nr:MAG: metal-dependent phosphohydrolase [Acidobacteria bacterium SCN 69-37]
MFSDITGLRRRAPGTVLVVDDLEANVSALMGVLRLEGYEVLTAPNGRRALDMVMADKPDVVVSDVRMPVMDGFALCRAMKADPVTCLIPVVLLTGATEAQDRLRAIEAGANDFLTKPIDQSELKARVRSLMQIKHVTDELDSAEAVLRSLALMIEVRDAYTEGHCQRLAEYATEMGTLLGLPDDDLQALARGGYFHDIGKIALPDAILLKPDALTDDEFERVKEHPVVGDRLCGDLRALHRVRSIVRHHHERLDGSGYPDGLKGDEIPLLAQIIGIVDVYDAMTTTRPYRAARSSEEALAALADEVSRGWRRADLVAVFAQSRRAAVVTAG